MGLNLNLNILNAPQAQRTEKYRQLNSPESEVNFRHAWESEVSPLQSSSAALCSTSAGILQGAWVSPGTPLWKFFI